MKVQLALPLSIAVSVVLVGLIKMRKKEHDREDRKNRFQEIKLRVTYDVLQEYQTEKVQKQNLLESQEIAYKALEVEVNTLKTQDDTAKGQLDICLSSQKSAKDELDAAEKELNSVKAQTEAENTSWKTEADTLQQKLAARSEVCNFLKPGSQAASQLCSIEAVPKAEEPKAEAPKPEEAKAEAPKPEEAKAEAPKPEEAKAEAPKPEEAKAEAPKPEEAKAEAPKPEEAKA